MFTKFLGICILIGSCVGAGVGYWSAVREMQQRAWEHAVYSIFLPPPPPPGYEWRMAVFYGCVGCLTGLVGGYFIQQRLPVTINVGTIPGRTEQEKGVWPPAPKF